MNLPRKYRLVLSPVTQVKSAPLQVEARKLLALQVNGCGIALLHDLQKRGARHKMRMPPRSYNVTESQVSTVPISDLSRWERLLSHAETYWPT